MQPMEPESRSTLPLSIQGNGVPESNDHEAEAAHPYPLFSRIGQCLGLRQKKSNCVLTKPPGDRLFPEDVGTVLNVYGEDIEYPRLRILTHTGCIKDGYCNIDDLLLMPDAWVAYSQWDGRALTPEIERLIPKCHTWSGRKFISDPTSVFVKAYGGVQRGKLNGAYPVLALVTLAGNGHSESVFLSSVHVFLESEGVEKAIKPHDWEILIDYWGKEIYAGAV
ncbi:hypothetical protein McanCB56680_007495 [Microsporum canis]